MSSATLNRSSLISTLSYSCKNVLMRTRSIDLSHGRFFAKPAIFFGAKTYIGETGLTTPPFFPNARRGANITLGALNDSPVIVNWNGLDPSERAEITPTLKIANNWMTKVERMSTMYDGMGLAHILPSRGLRKESNTDAHE